MDVEAPVPREEIAVGCPGSRRVGTIINGRYWRWRCRQKRCRHPDDPTGKSVRVYHIADLATGRLVATEYESASA